MHTVDTHTLTHTQTHIFRLGHATWSFSLARAGNVCARSWIVPLPVPLNCSWALTRTRARRAGHEQGGWGEWRWKRMNGQTGTRCQSLSASEKQPPRWKVAGSLWNETMFWFIHIFSPFLLFAQTDVHWSGDASEELRGGFRGQRAYQQLQLQTMQKCLEFRAELDDFPRVRCCECFMTIRPVLIP